MPGSLRHARSQPFTEVRKQCSTCEFSWIDKYGKDECPKCMTPLSAKPRKEPGEVSLHKYAPGEAFQSESGECPKGGCHLWRFGQCRRCFAAEGYAKHVCDAEGDNPSKNEAHDEKRRTCPTCSHTWMDRYRKNECPKCLTPLIIKKALKELGPGDALESTSDGCLQGGCHTWKLGRCTKCSIGEGYARHSTKPMLQRTQSLKETRRNCPECSFSWLDRHGKDKCPGCLSPAIVNDVIKMGRRHTIHQADEAAHDARKQCPTCAFTWLDKYGKVQNPYWLCERRMPALTCCLHAAKQNECPKCFSPLEGRAQRQRPKPNYQIAHMSVGQRKRCPTCHHSWEDHRGRDECPKCLSALKSPDGGPPVHSTAGEVSKFKRSPSDAMESVSGQCPRGGPHHWRFGRCAQCGRAEGYASCSRRVT